MFLTLLLQTTHASADAPITLKFGVHSTEEPTQVVRQFMPALKMLETSMSQRLSGEVDIRMQIAKTVTQNEMSLSSGDVDFASFDALSFRTVKEINPKVRIVAAINAMNTNSLEPWVTRPGMKDRVFTALQDSLLSIKNSKVLTSLEAFGFVQSHKSQYFKATSASKVSLAPPKSTSKHITFAIAKRLHEAKTNAPRLLAAEKANP